MVMAKSVSGILIGMKPKYEILRKQETDACLH